MNELARQVYLNSLGIDSYIPRYGLMGAPEPLLHEIELPDDQGHDSSCQSLDADQITLQGGVGAESLVATLSTDSDPVVSNDTKIHLNQTDDVSRNVGEPVSIATLLSEESPVKKETAMQAKVAEHVPVRSEPVRFSLSLWRIEQEILIVDSRNLQLALPTDRLLYNMLVALGYPTSDFPKAEVIRWPMLDSSENQGEDAARDMLQGYFEAQLLKRPVKYLLLMGDEAIKYVLPDIESVEHMNCSPVFIDTWSVIAIRTHSLTELLQKPLLKSEVWHMIQALKKDTL